MICPECKKGTILGSECQYCLKDFETGNNAIEKIAEREFGTKELGVTMKKGKLIYGGTFKKKNIKEHFKKVKKAFGKGEV